MKTLSEAVQIQIIDQVGSTYRNLMLAGFKEYKLDLQMVDLVKEITNGLQGRLVKLAKSE